MEIFSKNWYNRLLSELSHTKELKIISPFIKEQIVRKMEDQFDFKNFELITRFNLQDFAMQVSDLGALKFCVEKKSSVFGVKNLHSKIYLFDKRAAIITSANLTTGGLTNNHECGIFITDKAVIKSLHRYFEELKVMAPEMLTLGMCKSWQTTLGRISIDKGKVPILPDYGAMPTGFDTTRNYYIKFFGNSDNRVELDFTVEREIESSLCHYACGFPLKKKPRQVNDGDVVFLARMTKNPRDYSIFGRAVALKFTDGRDQASQQEIIERPWKQRYPIYLRVRNPVFIRGTMADGVLLSDLLSKFDYNSFPSTRMRHDKGEAGIIPTKSLMRKAYVGLTHDAARWLEERFDSTIENSGKVSKKFITGLPRTTTDLSQRK